MVVISKNQYTLQNINHERCVKYLGLSDNNLQAFNYLWKKRLSIDSETLFHLHALLFEGTGSKYKGIYRNYDVEIAKDGTRFIDFDRVSAAMTEFFRWIKINNEPLGDIVGFASEVHYKLVTIHPFHDGNGRLSRLLMNDILIKNKYPPLLIEKSYNHGGYTSALNTRNTTGNRQLLDEFILGCLKESFDYFSKFTHNDHNEDNPKEY